jgi:cytochrome c oxidase subunit III
MSTSAAHSIHRDDEGAKIGMWLFIFTEILLFGGLFIVYSVYRYQNPVAFQLAADQLDVGIGTLNTVILLISSMTVAMSVTAIQKGNARSTILLLEISILLGLAFLVNKYFEWSGKFGHGIYPGSESLQELGQGEVLFFGLYFFMSGLHALHILIGLVLLGVMVRKVQKGTQDQGYYIQVENSGLYWHLVDLIWIYLFPLFYLIS